MTFNALSLRTCRILLMALLCGLFAGGASADGLLIPFFGVNFGGDSGAKLGDAVDASRFTWGASIAWMGAGVIGAEGDFGYSPDFFGKTDQGGSSVFTAAGNLLVGVPFGGQKGFGVRPYGLVGIGVVHPQGDAFGDRFDDKNKVSWDFGGGVMIFFGAHAGIRGDVRYFRTFEALEFLDIDITAAEKPGDLEFTRGSIGFVYRF